MKFEIESVKECYECAFCEEGIFCKLLCGEPTEVINGKPEWCPFDNEGSTITRRGVTVIKEPINPCSDCQELDCDGYQEKERRT